MEAKTKGRGKVAGNQSNAHQNNTKLTAALKSGQEKSEHRKGGQGNMRSEKKKKTNTKKEQGEFNTGQTTVEQLTQEKTKWKKQTGERKRA